jgi:hypothetical protein
MKKLRVLDPRRTRAVLSACAALCGVNALITTFFFPGYEAYSVFPPLLFAFWFVRRDRKREVTWMVALRECQVVAASLDDTAAHLDIWPRSEEVFIVDERRRRRSSPQMLAASLRTIAVPSPSPELLLRARDWLDADTRIDVSISVRVQSGATRVEDVELLEGTAFSHRFSVNKATSESD